MNTKRTAFSLIELMVVIIIMAMLLAISVPIFRAFADTGQANAHNSISGLLKTAWNRAIGENSTMALRFSRTDLGTIVHLYRWEQLKDENGNPIRDENGRAIKDFVLVPDFKEGHLPRGIITAPPTESGQPDLLKDEMQICFLSTGQLSPSHGSSTFFFVYDSVPNPPQQLEKIIINYYTGQLIE